MTDWLLSVVWYGSLLGIALGLVALGRPLVRLQPAFRRRPAAIVLAAVLTVALMIWLAPTGETIASPSTALDRAVPTYQFRETHAVLVNAPAERVRRAVMDVTAGEITAFQLFTAVRRLGRSTPESILNAPADQPIMDVATRSGFILLADTEHEIALGSVVSAPRGVRDRSVPMDAAWFETLAAPGVVKAALNFMIEAADSSHTRLTTETRVFATDRRAVHAFTAYWRTIFPGSWILRVTWLDAIAARAERVD
jgi:hypothetical protein